MSIVELPSVNKEVWRGKEPDRVLGYTNLVLREMAQTALQMADAKWKVVNEMNQGGK